MKIQSIKVDMQTYILSLYLYISVKLMYDIKQTKIELLSSFVGGTWQSLFSIIFW